jgi:hypothetical protein
MKVIVKPGAFEDFLRAYYWYGGTESEIGERLSESFDQFLEDIERFPFIYPKVYGKFRKGELRSFKYHAYYRIDGNKIFVLLIAHAHRNPRWIKRALRDRS